MKLFSSSAFGKERNGRLCRAQRCEAQNLQIKQMSKSDKNQLNHFPHISTILEALRANQSRNTFILSSGAGAPHTLLCAVPFRGRVASTTPTKQTKADGSSRLPWISVKSRFNVNGRSSTRDAKSLSSNFLLQARVDFWNTCSS